MNKRFRNTIDNRNTTSGIIFDLFIQITIFVSIISFSCETLPNLTPFEIKILRTTDIICISIFTLEYILRIIVAKNKIKYIFSFYGLIDLISILPFYLTTTFDFMVLRAFRFLRLLSLFKISRYSHVFNRINLALKYAKEELIVFLTTTLILLYISAVGIFYFEHPAQPDKFVSIFDSLWWAVATLTTVGYGDIYPITIGGKLFTFCVLMIGLGIVALPAGIISSSLTKARIELDNKEKEKNHDKADHSE